MIKTRGVAHFSIAVSDVERAERFYAGVLGMKVLRRSRERGMVFLDSGGDCVILVRSDAPINPLDERDIHHSFIVDGDAYAAAQDDLRAQGVEILFEEDRRGGAVNGPRFYFHDPDGNVLELIDLTSYQGAEPD